MPLCSPRLGAGKANFICESSSWSSHPGLKKLQALELHFPKDLSSSGEQEDGEIPTLAGTLYHLGPNRLRKTQGIDPHPQ